MLRRHRVWFFNLGQLIRADSAQKDPSWLIDHSTWASPWLTLGCTLEVVVFTLLLQNNVLYTEHYIMSPYMFLSRFTSVHPTCLRSQLQIRILLAMLTRASPFDIDLPHRSRLDSKFLVLHSHHLLPCSVHRHAFWVLSTCQEGWRSAKSLCSWPWLPQQNAAHIEARRTALDFPDLPGKNLTAPRADACYDEDARWTSACSQNSLSIGRCRL